MSQTGAGSRPRAGDVIVRVRYPETDRMGVAYHAHYLTWFELGRTELLREAGQAYREIEDVAGLLFPVIEVGAKYHAPARYDDVLEVRTRVTKMRGARVRFEYLVRRQGEARPLATGFTEHAIVGRGGRPQRIPEDLRQRLEVRVEPRS